jgi:hypothetical protein
MTFIRTDIEQSIKYTAARISGTNSRLLKIYLSDLTLVWSLHILEQVAVVQFDAQFGAAAVGTTKDKSSSGFRHFCERLISRDDTLFKAIPC